MKAGINCFNCGSRGMLPFYSLENVPVHSCLLMPDRDAAINYPRGNILLGFCDTCGFISNLGFDPCVHDYSSKYEETQGFSGRFRAFAHSLASRLVEGYHLRGKNILEIGCGKGEFLTLLCELGRNQGLGIDPSFVSERGPRDAALEISFIKDFYSEKYIHLAADFICCRHTLEHIQATQAFLRLVRASIGDRKNTVVFFEVPDISRVLKEQAFWDIYYEHCSYFSLGSLARLFRSCGFAILELATDFDDQYLLLVASPNSSCSTLPLEKENDLEVLKRQVVQFEKSYRDKIGAWRSGLRQLIEQERRAVIWGSGSKAVAYLTTLGIRDEIEYIVDINPFKQGMYLSGTGHPIVAPKFLTEYRPDVVIAMNPIYRDEIQSDLNKMGLSAELIAV